MDETSAKEGSIEDYIKANLHYLPKEKQELFCAMTGHKIQEYSCKKYYEGGECQK